MPFTPRESRTRLRVEHLEDRTAPAIVGTVHQFFVNHNVNIQSIDGVSADIDPAATTWIVVHGRNDSAAGKRALAESIQLARPDDQVLLLDWSGAAASTLIGQQGEGWIVPVANWAANALAAHGFVGSHINIVGHSWGAYVGAELAARFPGGAGVNSIVALDPPMDYPFNFLYNPGDGHINFAAHAGFSWAFHARDLTSFIPVGSFVTPQTASETFTVAGADHNAVVDVFRDLLERPTAVSSHFSLDRLVSHQPSADWVPNRFLPWGTWGTLFPGLRTYEAVIGAQANPDASSTIHRRAVALTYFDSATPGAGNPMFAFGDDGLQLPTIATMIGPQSIKQGKNLILTAAGVHSSGDVTDVTFFRDSNGNGISDAGDTLLGHGSQSGNNWTLTVSTSGWAMGNTRIFIEAHDGETTPGTRTIDFDLTVTAPAPRPHDLYATGTDFGGDPLVNVYDGTTGTSFSFHAYAKTFKGGVRVATGDVNGDGVEDLITGAGPYGGPHVKVFDGVTHAEIRSFFGLASNFTGGIWVAAGDLNDDGYADIIVGADGGGSPQVRVFSGKDNSLLSDFLAYGSQFTGGVRVASGDFNGDGIADLLTAAGPNGGPHVRAINGFDGSDIASYFVYAPTFTGGIFVAAGDVDGDGNDDYITGAGLTGGPHVKVYSGATQGEMQSFFAANPLFNGGVRVSVMDRDGDGKADLVTSLGREGDPKVRVFKGNTLALLADIQAYDPVFLAGVYVG